jgi:drug/metabolite transporter (DMT)-like permease
MMAVRRKPLKVNKFGPWIWRGILGAVGMVLYYLSIDLGTAGRASLLNNTYPLFVALISAVVLRKRFGWPVLAALALSFLGVGVIFRESVMAMIHSWIGGAAASAGAEGGTGLFVSDILGLASGVIAGGSFLLNKKASETEDPVVIYLGVCLVGCFVCAFSAGQARFLDAASVVASFLAALTAFLGQVTITAGLRDLPATEGSLISYLKIPITILIAWIFLGEPMGWGFIAGTLLISVGLLIERMWPLIRGRAGLRKRG